MPRTAKPLFDTEVKQAKPKAKEYNLADGNRLYLRVKPNGTKLWIYQYPRPYTKKRTNLSLGKYPDLPLADARDEAAELNAQLAKGVDPEAYRKEKEKKKVEAHTLTFEVAYRRWLEIKAPTIRESYKTGIESVMEQYVLPDLGPVPVFQITAPMVIDILEPAAKKRVFETVRKLCRWTNEVMVYCVNIGAIHHNPLAGIRNAFEAPNVTNRPSIKPDELPAFLKTLEEASISLETRCQIEWLLHTMVRPLEGASTRWADIDVDNALWTIPAERMKMKRPHTVPLTPQALNILKTMRPISGHREFVFPSHKNPREHMNSETANMAIKRMGYGGRLVAHGLRSLSSTILNEHEFDSEMIEVSQARVDRNKVRAAYNRAEYIRRRRIMMEWWSDYIEAAAMGKPIQNKGVKNLKAVGATQN